MAISKIIGENIKRDGTSRQWDAIPTGVKRRAHDGALMVEVIEGDERKWLNISTFTGLLEFGCVLQEWVRGECVDECRDDLPEARPGSSVSVTGSDV